MPETQPQPQSLHSRMWVPRPDHDRYVQRMDAQPHEKLDVIKEYLGHLPPDAEIYSIGAGSGQLEESVAQITGATVFASDISPNMLVEIAQRSIQLEEKKRNNLARGRLIPVGAEAEGIPRALASTDAVLCFSVIHEIASFGHDFDFGKLKHFFADTLQRLKPGGILLIRDFMQPENAQTEITLKVGVAPKAEDPSKQEMDPREFIEFFVANFKGDSGDVAAVAQQVEQHKQAGTWQAGATLKMSRAFATELMAHSSWQSSKEDEVKEKYAYHSPANYSDFIQKAGHEVGIATQVLQATSVVLDGYRQHVSGRLDIIDPITNEPQDLPAWTGVIAIQRVDSNTAISPTAPVLAPPAASEAVWQ